MMPVREPGAGGIRQVLSPNPRFLATTPTVGFGRCNRVQPKRGGEARTGRAAQGQTTKAAVSGEMGGQRRGGAGAEGEGQRRERDLGRDVTVARPAVFAIPFLRHLSYL